MCWSVWYQWKPRTPPLPKSVIGSSKLLLLTLPSTALPREGSGEGYVPFPEFLFNFWYKMGHFLFKIFSYSGEGASPSVSPPPLNMPRTSSNVYETYIYLTLQWQHQQVLSWLESVLHLTAGTCIFGHQDRHHLSVMPLDFGTLLQLPWPQAELSTYKHQNTTKPSFSFSRLITRLADLIFSTIFTLVHCSVLWFFCIFIFPIIIVICWSISFF